MANTSFNTRLKLKYDSLANWQAANPVLLAGEVAVVTIATHSPDSFSLPTVMFKVGDGTSTFNELKYAAAPAADVYGWAKAATKPEYTATEITNLESFIAGKVQDTNTKYKVEKGDDNKSFKLYHKDLADADWTLDTTIELSVIQSITTGTTNGTISVDGTDVAVNGLGSAAYTNSTAYDAAGAANTALENAKTYADTAVSTAKTAIEGTIGTVTEGKTVVDMINDAKTAATYDDTALAGRVSTIEGDYLKEADKTELANATKAVSDELTKQKDASQEGTLAAQIKAEKDRMDAFMSAADVGANAVDTMKEIQDYITTHGEAAATMVKNIGDNKTTIEAEVTRATNAEGGLDERITTLETAIGENGSVASQITSAIEALDVAAVGGEGKYISTISETDGKITATAVDMPTALKNPNALTISDTTYDGSAAVAISDAKIREIVGLPDSEYAPAFDGTYNHESNKIATVSTVTSTIEALDVEDAAVAGQVVSAVSETDGKITVSRRALVADDIPTLTASKISDLHTVATSGKIDDLEQTNYIILDCGTSSTVMG